MKKILLLLIMAIALNAQTIGQKLDQFNAEARKKIGLDIDRQKPQPLNGKHLFVTLTTKEPLKAGMAISLSISALKKGSKVNMFIGADAMKYVWNTNGSKEIFPPKNMLITDLLKRFMELGGRVMICKMCVKSSGRSADNILTGATVNNSLDYFDELMFKSTSNLEF